jgi:hypothetical protein
MGALGKSRWAQRLVPILQDPRWREFTERYALDLPRFSVEVCGCVPTFQQLEFFKSVQRKGSRVSVSSGHGCFAAGTQMMRASGDAVAVEEIRVGDQLMGPDGASVRNVLELKRGREAMYRFIYSDGTSHTFNESHILCLVATNSKGRRVAGQKITVTVREWLTWGEDKKRCHAVYRSGVQTFEGGSTELPVPAYVLGLWLGDGDTAQAAITTGDPEVDDAFAAWVESLGCTVRREENSANSWRLYARRPDGRRSNPAMQALRCAGLGEQKRIPREYMRASLADRLELLAGLIDTDGHLDNGSGGFDFVQKSEHMARDVAWLARSVGCHATVRRVQKVCVNNGVHGTYWRVTIGRNVEMIPVRLARKKPPPRPKQRQNLHFSIKAVEALGEGDYFGFVLDGDSRFLGHDFTVLHNTGKTQAFAIVLLWHLTCYLHSNTILSGPKLEIVLSGVRKYVADIHGQIEQGVHAWIAPHIVIAQESIFIKGYKNQWWAKAKTAPAGKPEGMAGEHRKFMLWLIDEASGVDDKVMNIILGSLTQEWNRIALASQPTRATGVFYDSHHRLNVKRGGIWTAIVMSSEESPLVTDQFIEEKLLQYGGRHDPQYQIKVLGRFPEKLEGQLMSRAQLEACIGREYVIKQGMEWGWLVLVDVAAGEYRDKSVVMVAKVSGHGQFHEPDPRRMHIVKLAVVSNTIQPTALQAEIVQVAARLNNATILIDGGGMGLAVYKRLEEMGQPGLVKVLWGRPCWRKTAQDQFFNQRAQGMVGFAKAVIAGHVSIEPDAFPDMRTRDEFLDQSRVPYHYNDKAQYVIESKGSKAWEGLPSPDMVDAGSFGYLEQAHYIVNEASLTAANDAISIPDAVERIRAMRAGMLADLQKSA